MNEQKARNISLLLISIEILAVYLLVVFSGLDAQINQLAYRTDVPIAGLVIFIGFFTVFAVIVLLSAFFRWIYYFLAVSEIAVSIFIILYFRTILFGSADYEFILSATVISPLVVYLILLLFVKKKGKSIQG